MSNRTLAQELRGLAPNVSSGEATPVEVDALIEDLMGAARRAATDGETKAAVLLDKFVRKDPAKVPLPKTRIIALEKHFQERGICATFTTDLACVWCHVRECKKGTHWGYFITW